MPSLAATTTLADATHGHNLDGLLSAALVGLLIVTVGYLLWCWLFPFTRCRHRGIQVAARCQSCQGTNRRVRAGRHLINRIRSMRRH